MRQADAAARATRTHPRAGATSHGTSGRRSSRRRAWRAAGRPATPAAGTARSSAAAPAPAGSAAGSRRAPAARPRRRRRRRRAGRLLRRDQLRRRDRPGSWLELVVQMRRRHGHRPARHPQPGAVGRPDHRRAGHRAVPPDPGRRPDRPRHDRPRPGHQAVLPRRGDLHRLRHRAGRPRRVALGLPHVAGRPAQGRPLPAAGCIIVGTDRRAIALDRACSAPTPRPASAVVGLVGSAREARAAGLADLWLANYADAGDVLAAGRRRRRRAVLERHQPGAARRADPRRAARATATCTSTRACRASTSAASRRCRSPTSRCCTSRRRRCRGCRSSCKRALRRRRRRARCSSSCRRVLALVAVAHQARGPRSGAVPPAARRPRRRRVRDAQVPLDVRRRRGPAGRPAGGQRAHAARCSSSTAATHGSPGSAASCGRPASTSCRSCSTCCAAT